MRGDRPAVCDDFQEGVSMKIAYKLKSVIAATAIILGTATMSNAATFGSIPGAGGGTNDLLDDVFGAGTTSRQGWYGATLYLTGLADITATYLGKEAGFNNTFHWSGAEIFNSGTAVNASQLFNNVAAGMLDFAFGINSGVASLFNGANPGSGGPSNFFVTFENEIASSGQIAYLFLDDSGSADDNHDDLVVRLAITNGNISIAPIPLPAAGFLLIGGLGALAAVARRRKQS